MSFPQSTAHTSNRFPVYDIKEKCEQRGNPAKKSGRHLSNDQITLIQQTFGALIPPYLPTGMPPFHPTMYYITPSNQCNESNVSHLQQSNICPTLSYLLDKSHITIQHVNQMPKNTLYRLDYAYALLDFAKYYIEQGQKKTKSEEINDCMTKKDRYLDKTLKELRIIGDLDHFHPGYYSLKAAFMNCKGIDYTNIAQIEEYILYQRISQFLEPANKTTRQNLESSLKDIETNCKKLFCTGKIKFQTYLDNKKKIDAILTAENPFVLLFVLDPSLFQFSTWQQYQPFFNKYPYLQTTQEFDRHFPFLRKLEFLQKIDTTSEIEINSPFVGKDFVCEENFILAKDRTLTKSMASIIRNKMAEIFYTGKTFSMHLQSQHHLYTLVESFTENNFCAGHRLTLRLCQNKSQLNMRTYKVFIEKIIENIVFLKLELRFPSDSYFLASPF